MWFSFTCKFHLSNVSNVSHRISWWLLWDDGYDHTLIAYEGDMITWKGILHGIICTRHPLMLHIESQTLMSSISEEGSISLLTEVVFLRVACFEYNLSCVWTAICFLIRRPPRAGVMSKHGLINRVYAAQIDFSCRSYWIAALRCRSDRFWLFRTITIFKSSIISRYRFANSSHVQELVQHLENPHMNAGGWLNGNYIVQNDFTSITSCDFADPTGQEATHVVKRRKLQEPPSSMGWTPWNAK